MDEAQWGIVIAVIGVIVGIPTLYFAARSFLLQARQVRESKMATLEFADVNQWGRIWHFMNFSPGYADRHDAHFEGYFRNRGPGVAYDMEWAAFAGSEQIELSGGRPHFLYPTHDAQVVIKVPLAVDLSPTADVIRVHVQWTDDDKHKGESWCFQFTGEPEGDPHVWIATEIDCNSRKTKGRA